MSTQLGLGPDATEQAKGLREERAVIRQQMEALLKKAKDEERSLTADELAEFDRMDADFKTKTAELKVIENSVAELVRSDHFAEIADRAKFDARRNPDAVSAFDEDMAFRGWLLAGTPHFTDAHQRAIEKCGSKVVPGAEQTRNFEMPAIRQMSGAKTFEALTEARRFAREIVQTRATTAQTITTTGGGNLIGNDNSFIARLQEALIMNGSVRSVATVIQTDSGATLPIPGFAGNQSGVNTAINTEVATADASFSQQTLGRYKYGSMIKLPVELITDAAIDVQAWSGMELGRRLNRVQEQEFATGAATLSECEGILTTGSSGGAAAGSVNQSSAGNVTFADLNSLVHDVDPNFRVGATWIWHDTIAENVNAQLDGDGYPLFRVSPNVGEPDMYLGYRAVVNNLYPSFAGSTANESTKLLSFGRHSDYFVRDVRGTAVQVLRERFATAGQIAVLAFAQSYGEYINPHGGSSLSSIKYMAETSS